MAFPVMALLAAQGLVFVAWTFVMFRTLFRLRARAVARTGSAFPGPGATLQTFQEFLTLPEFRGTRRLLGGLTVLFFALTAVFATVAPRG